MALLPYNIEGESENDNLERLKKFSPEELQKMTNVFSLYNELLTKSNAINIFLLDLDDKMNLLGEKERKLVKQWQTDFIWLNTQIAVLNEKDTMH